jgi:general secretion pathway protein G
MSTVKGENAFSLIEIIVVLALLAIVLLAVFRNFNTDLGKAKDAQRKDDLNNIKLAMEDYYSDHNSYPPPELLQDCDGPAMQPYLKEVPCDPVTGEPYLYLPDLISSTGIHAYRVLSYLSSSQDPIVEQLGCQNGCGIPEDHPSFQQSLKYIYGVAEGVPLVLADLVIPTMTVTVTATPTVTPSPSPALDCSIASSQRCYCCAGSNQGCNLYNTGYGTCVFGPFETIEECHNNTPCTRPNHAQ